MTRLRELIAMMKKLFEIDWLKYLTWGLLLLMVGFVIKAWESPPMPAAIYWFELEFLSLRRQLACLCIPVFLFLACIWVIRQEKTRGVRVWIPVMLLFSNILACASSVPGFVYENKHQGGIVYDNRVYYVMTSYGGLGIGGVTRPYVYLYECDQFGLFCQEIYIYTGWQVSVGEAQLWTASLMTDYAAETISLIVNGESVYTYQPE